MQMTWRDTVRRSRIVLAALALTAALACVPAGAATAGAVPADVPGPPSGTLVPGTRHLVFAHPDQQIILRLYGHTGERLFLFQHRDDGNSPDLSFDLYEPAAAGGTEIVHDAYAIDSGTTLPASGAFTIVFYITDGSVSTTDVVSDLNPNVDGGDLEPGQTVTGQTSHPAQQIIYHFAGHAGQRPTLSATKQSFGEIIAEFIGPDGTRQPLDPYHPNDLLSHYQPFAEGAVLDQTGTWTLVLDPDPDSYGSLTFTFGLVQDPALSPITGHRSTRLAVDTPGVNVSRSFRMARGQKLQVTLDHIAMSRARGSSVQAVDPTMTVRLIVPSGYQIYSANLTRDTVTPVRYTLGFAPETGRYVVELDPDHNTVGRVDARVDQFSDKHVEASIGTPTQVSAREPTQETSLRFDAAYGQHLSVTVAGAAWTIPGSDGSPTPCTAPTCPVYVFLIGPNNNTVNVGDATTDGTLAVPGTLPNSGSYTLVIEPVGEVTGSATITINPTG